MAADIRVKRAYDDPSPDDGTRILVDGLWPRGLTKDALAITAWFRDLAPSAALRARFNHRPERFADFQAAYAGELAGKAARCVELLTLAKRGRLTLVFAARDAARNNAVALREYLLNAVKPSTTVRKK